MQKLIVLFAVVLISGCAAGLHSDVPLVWKPTSDLYRNETTTQTGLYSNKYKIMPFEDNRENKKQIAKNVEGNTEKFVTTSDNIANWCGSRFKAILKQHGFNIVEDKESIIIKGDILQFYVTEDKLYKADVGIKITAENTAGKILWQGVMTGKSKRFGRSYKLENYYETLSDAYLEAISSLLRNQEFRTSLAAKE